MEIKNIFIKLIKKYQLEFFGYSLVHIYANDKYGVILEISKIYSTDFYTDIIDLKVIVHQDTPFFLELDDYPFDEKVKCIVHNKKFYVNFDDIENILHYIEYGKIIYKSVVSS